MYTKAGGSNGVVKRCVLYSVALNDISASVLVGRDVEIYLAGDRKLRIL